MLSACESYNRHGILYYITTGLMFLKNAGTSLGDWPSPMHAEKFKIRYVYPLRNYEWYLHGSHSVVVDRYLFDSFVHLLLLGGHVR